MFQEMINTWRVHTSYCTDIQTKNFHPYNMMVKNRVFLNIVVPYWVFKYSMSQAVCLQIYIFFIRKHNNNLPYLGLLSSYYISLGITPGYILYLLFHFFHDSLMNHFPWLNCFGAWNSFTYSHTKFNFFQKHNLNSFGGEGGDEYELIVAS